VRYVPGWMRPSPRRELAMRRRAAEVAGRVATRLHDHLEYVGVDHLPQGRDRPLWGHGKPPNPRLERIISGGEAAYAEALEQVASYRVELARVAKHGPAPGEPHWCNAWIPPYDGAALYSAIRGFRPRRYVEVGSGISTLWAHRARRDGETGTVITSIDPSPRADVDAVCDHVVRGPLESSDLSVFGEVGPGDMVFVDNSHHALLGSDVATFFFDILPVLVPGVLVGIHDILLPDDYFPFWADYYFSEQYVLAGMLMAGDGWWEPVLAAWWASRQPRLASVLDPLWEAVSLDPQDRFGTSFWFRTTGGFPSGQSRSER
jgi:predicted O-methyltransferase YrrM